MVNATNLLISQLLPNQLPSNKPDKTSLFQKAPLEIIQERAQNVVVLRNSFPECRIVPRV